MLAEVTRGHDGIYLETVVGAGISAAVAFAKKHFQPINHGPNKDS
jgi:hypothetical protein